MADFKMPKGRMTVRKNGGRRVRLWELGDSQNPTVQKVGVGLFGRSRHHGSN
jgi:hypothetical protein